MPEEPQERIYKHQVTADFVLEAITTLEWSAEQTNKFEAKGIYRDTLFNLKSRIQELQFHELNIKDNEVCTLIVNTEIKDNEVLNLSNIKQILPHIILLDSKWNFVEIKDNNLSKELGKYSEQKTTQFNIINSITGEIEINKSKIGDFSIEKSQMDNFRVLNNCQTKNISIEKSKTGNFIISDNSTIDDFWIDNNCITGSLVIEKNSTTGSFNIMDNSAIGDFWVYDNCTIENFEIDYSFMNRFDLINSTIGDVTIIKNNTIGDFWIGENCNLGNFLIEKDNTIGNFKIENSKSPLIEIENAQASFHFSKATIGQCQLNNCDISKLTIKNGCEMELYISSGIINLIDFEKLTLGNNTTVSFSKTNIFACNMNEFSALGNLYFRGIKASPEPYKFIDIENYLGQESGEKKLNRLYSIKMERLIKQKKEYERDVERWQENRIIRVPTFRIEHSSLGKTEFIECDFEGFDFEFKDSKISDTFIAGGKLPKMVMMFGGGKYVAKKGRHYNDEELEEIKLLMDESSEQAMAFYNQLKKIFGAQGDTIRSVHYKALAERQHFEKMRTKKNKWINPDWWIYFFNYLSNNFGISWVRALLFTLIVGLSFFRLYNLSLSPNPYIFEWGNTDFLKDFGQFLLPTHKFNFIEGVNITPMAATLDIISRLFIGYGIYQFISAFRKHGKRA